MITRNLLSVNFCCASSIKKPKDKVLSIHVNLIFPVFLSVQGVIIVLVTLDMFSIQAVGDAKL